MNAQRILEQLRAYIQVESLSGTAKESEAAQWLYEQIAAIPWFGHHKDHFGLWPCEQDTLNRSIVWALLRGKRPETVMFYHHHDVVGVTDFGQHQPWAFDSEALENAYRRQTWPEAIQADLDSEAWVWGRGSCDMKGGGVAQLAFLEEMASGELPELSILLLSVPDEENLSLGMRSAMPLLQQLKERFHLDYTLAVNSEPGFGRTDDVMACHTGSVGKMTVMAHVQGFQCHVGSPFDGLNAAALLGAIVSGTENHPELVGYDEGLMTPPPVWAMSRDLKKVMDVSLPASAVGYINLLYLKEGVKVACEKLRNAMTREVENYLNRRSLCHRTLSQNAIKPLSYQEFSIPVMMISELLEQIKRLPLERQQTFNQKWNLIGKAVSPDKAEFCQATTQMIEVLLETLQITTPIVVLALVPPIYPAVSLRAESSKWLMGVLEREMVKHSHMPLEREAYFMGISDMSYCNLGGEAGIASYLASNLPLWSSAYEIPMLAIEALNIPTINLGPRGRDLHQKTERVSKADLILLPKLFKALIEALSLRDDLTVL